MKTIINDLKKHKIFILFIVFWILVIVGALDYMIDDLQRTNSNRELINRNYEELIRKDLDHQILLKNDSIILEKLEELTK